jgi:hypothetical protein
MLRCQLAWIHHPTTRCIQTTASLLSSSHQVITLGHLFSTTLVCHHHDLPGDNSLSCQLGFLKGLGILALAQTGPLRGREIGSRQVQCRRSLERGAEADAKAPSDIYLADDISTFMFFSLVGRKGSSFAPTVGRVDHMKAHQSAFADIRITFTASP